MTDESVDTFYSCTLCQSFAPNHVCMITPERLGLCGAYNWLDGQAAYEINPTGCNQPVPKGKCHPRADRRVGRRQQVRARAAPTAPCERFSAYSLMQNPMTSCGCFECIVAIVPEANGVMVVNREYPGETPIGMPFSTLAGSVGGGAQTPGFLGVGPAVPGQPQVHPRRGRAAPAGLDAQGPQGGHARAARETRRRDETGGLRGQDRRRDRRHDLRAAAGAPAARWTTRP